VRHVADLARRVREGEPLAEDLVTAARELQRWYDDPTGGCCPEPCEFWLSWGKGSMTTEPTAVADLMSTVMRRVRRNGTGFLAATAPQIRTIFDVSPRTPLADRLGGHNLATLPRELPTTDQTPVVLYDARTAVASLLSAVGRHEDTTNTIAHLVNRVVHQHKHPWEH
jgi:hypothetical protein